MIHLRIRSEYSFKQAYGRLPDVLDIATGEGQRTVALTDRTTFGHVNFRKLCKARDLKPIYGVELPVVLDAKAKGKDGKQTPAVMAFLAKTDEGLREIYNLVSRAHSKDNFYYFPRIEYADVNALTTNVVILSGHQAYVEKLTFRPNVYLELNPSNARWNAEIVQRFPHYQKVVCASNLYPRIADRQTYEILAGERLRVARTTIMHIPTEAELRLAIPQATDDDFLNTDRIAADCDAHLPDATMVSVTDHLSLRTRCTNGAINRRLLEHNRTTGEEMWKDQQYLARMERELDIIQQKGFENYFRVVGDMVRWAKAHMFVGPARGSAAGSLVSYLLGITDVDPLQHDLLFERFIDLNRSDFPDIDVDFADDKREQVFEYLRTTYGSERVARVGNVLRYKPRSALNDVVRSLGIPNADVDPFKDAVEARFAGDERATDCIVDALATTDVGKAIITKYPALAVAGELEGHCTTTGTHAGGVVITEHPVTDYCSIGKDGVAQVDKKDAETLGMVKVDVLGLSMLGVIGDCLEQVGKEREWLVNFPRDDASVFDIFNQNKVTGVFQFEGDTQRRLMQGMGVHDFTDIEALNALSRPGPLASGTTEEYIKRRLGLLPVEYLHPSLATITKDTYGCIIYQEQVMRICREIGGMPWPDVTDLRKSMAKTMGQEAFNKFFAGFWMGAKEHMTEPEAKLLWDRLVTFGSYAFNKSHSTAYAYVAYWCAVLKRYYPLNFGAALLKKADTEQGINILRELVREGYEYVPVDVERSGVTWTVVDGKLVGGLTNVKGIAAKTAQDILDRRAEGRPLQPGHIAKLAAPKTPYDDLFAAHRLYGPLYEDPAAHNVTSGVVSQIRDITDLGEYLIVAKIIEKRVRDLNEPDALARRKGRVIKRHNLWLQLTVADDSGSREIKISTRDWDSLGKALNEFPLESWLLWRVRWKDEKWPSLDVLKVKKLPPEGYARPSGP